MTTNTTNTTKALRVRLYKGVSCVTCLKGSEPYGDLHTNYFDVPNESFTDGGLTGVKVAFEVMAAARNGDFDSFQSVCGGQVVSDTLIGGLCCRFMLKSIG